MAGKTGVWLYQIGDRQEYRVFALSRTHFTPPAVVSAVPATALAWSSEYKTPKVPSPQARVLVLEHDRKMS